MKHLNIIVLLLLLVPMQCVFAAKGQDKLKQFYQDVTSLSANFTQEVQSQDFTKVEISKGSLQMQRPGRFRWDYTEPYEQQIIADGRQLWIFDVDMDQVIVKSLDQALGSTPAVLLSGNTDLKQGFEIKDIKAPTGSDATLSWVELKPKQEESGFQVLLLGFAQDLKEMRLTDAFGQVTRIEFTELKRNPTLKAAIFDFTPPPGVDVLSDK